MKCLTDGNVVWMSPSSCIGDLVREERRNLSPCFHRDFTWVVLLCQVSILALPQRAEVRDNYSLVSLPFFSSENHNDVISFLACLLLSTILQISMTTIWCPQTTCSLLLRHYPSKQGGLELNWNSSNFSLPGFHFPCPVYVQGGEMSSPENQKRSELRASACLPLPPLSFWCSPSLVLDVTARTRGKHRRAPTK